MANPRVESDNYDPNIVPAETAARKEREQEDYKQRPDKEGNINTTKGYTVDQEGLSNNYAIEPEMYINEPGDLAEEQAQNKAERAKELADRNQTNEDGNLTVDSDDRSKGVGII